MSISALIEAGDIAGIKAYMEEHRLVLRGNKIVPADEDVKKGLQASSEFWNQRQQAR